MRSRVPSPENPASVKGTGIVHGAWGLGALNGFASRSQILAFDPPDRVVFSWDISPRWTIETDQAQTSEVEVRFYAESPTRTRVELEHRHIDRHGPGWEAVTEGIDGPEGWPLYLDRYAALLTEGR